MESTQQDRDLLPEISGLYIGQLTDDELEAFHRCRVDGLCRADYQGTSGLLGIGKVRLTPQGEQ